MESSGVGLRGLSLEVGWTTTLTLLVVAGFAFFSAAGWPGDASPCLGQPCWCEPIRSGPIREPWNTLSNLPLFALALGMAAHAAAARRRSMARAHAVLSVFAYALWIEGTGALYYHASLVEWAAIIDGSSVLTIWGAIISTSLFRLFRFSPSVLVLCVALLLLAAVIYRVGQDLPVEIAGFFMMLTTLTLEPVILRRHRNPGPAWKLRIALGALVASAAVWGLALPGGALCEAGIPFHAVWHILAGLAVTFFGLHAAESAERDRA